MPKFHKPLRGYLSKFKPRKPHTYLPSTASFSSSRKWIPRSCNHTKTLSFAIDNTNGVSGDTNKTDEESATLSDIDRFLFENFKSLYLRDDEDDQNHKRGDAEEKETPKLGPAVFPDPPRSMRTPADHCGSSRFFVSPGLSSSVIEEGGTSVITTSDEVSSSFTSISSSILIESTPNSHRKEKDRVTHTPIPGDSCIAIFTYSASPGEDFRRSMQEMVDARLRNDEGVDWEFMEELLFSYMKLNHKKSYKHILNAFVDMIVVLRQNPETVTQTRTAGQKSSGCSPRTGSSVPEGKSAPETGKNIREANQEFDNKE